METGDGGGCHSDGFEIKKDEEKELWEQPWALGRRIVTIRALLNRIQELHETNTNILLFVHFNIKNIYLVCRKYGPYAILLEGVAYYLIYKE